MVSILFSIRTSCNIPQRTILQGSLTKGHHTGVNTELADHQILLLFGAVNLSASHSLSFTNLSAFHG